MQILINGLVGGLLWGLVAVGFSLVYSTARFLHVAQAATYLVGAYTGIWLLKNSNVSIIVATIAATLSAIGLGVLMEIGIYRPLRKAGSSSLILFVSSLALVVIVQNTIGLVFGSEIQVVSRNIEQDTFQVLDGRITSWQAISSAVTVVIFVITWLFLRFTIIGKKVRAVASDWDLAQVVGVNRDGILLVAVAIGSALAGLAGFLICYDTAVTPISGFGVLLIAVTAAIIGGLGSIRGAMLGGLFVGIVQHIGIWKLPPQWQDAIVFVILILFLLLRPQGFLGRNLSRVAE